MDTPHIKLKAMCIFQRDNQILVGNDPKYPFYRIIGGTIELGETAEQCIKREIKEELDSNIYDLELITVLENIFLDGPPPTGHEIVFLFKGKADEKIYSLDTMPILDKEGHRASWIKIEDIVSKKLDCFPPFDYASLIK